MNAALDGFDQDEGAEETEDVREEAGEKEQPADVRLQRVGLEQRLADLEQKQKQIQEALERELDAPSLQAKGPAQKEESKKVQLQEDDTFLDEELDNAGNSAMVETERDRLIRLVRVLTWLLELQLLLTSVF